MKESNESKSRARRQEASDESKRRAMEDQAVAAINNIGTGVREGSSTSYRMNGKGRNAPTVKPVSSTGS
ncbi:hypothetical protein Tdes44962_MAKER03153 [Teratosphaeria destructans]|uniref:Uncharacterized protein n=1 Tax=Teratosphaeria destructans TaxID=418781 RepID=A0A9W7W1W9_9PEZI|nr:hypothetical protein Tdes44962_MAKER03153 [Teratosphaeria destructans]